MSQLSPLEVRSSNEKSLLLLGLIANKCTRRIHGFGQCGGASEIRTCGKVKGSQTYPTFAAFAAAGLLDTQLTHDWSINDFIPMVLLQSVGHSLALFAAIMIALANTDLTKSTAFVAYVQVVRLGSAEIGVALMTTWLWVREQFHSNMLGQHVASGDSNVTDFLSKLAGFFDSPDSSLAQARGVASLAALVQREANTLAYIDGFWLTVYYLGC